MIFQTNPDLNAWGTDKHTPSSRARPRRESQTKKAGTAVHVLSVMRGSENGSEIVVALCVNMSTMAGWCRYWKQMRSRGQDLPYVQFSGKELEKNIREY